MFENTFKNIDQILWKDDGCSTELDYIEQTSWIIFLKYLEDLEIETSSAYKLMGKKYDLIFDESYRWSKWAYPKLNNGKQDHDSTLLGNDLINFVNQKLFPYLSNFKKKNDNINSLEYKIGQIFDSSRSGVRNKIESGYNLREIIDHVEKLKFRSKKDKDEMSHLYEDKIKNMGNAGRNGGEFYTPRPLISTMVSLINPKIGNKIFDPSCGSAGFLVESFNYLKNKKNLTTSNMKLIQEKTLFGKEKKSLPFIIGNMNMILHGIQSPNIIRTNTLNENILDFTEKDKYDVILANPPFGGKERSEIKNNFPIKTKETANLFLQYFCRSLKNNGKCAVIVKNTILSNNLTLADALIRKELITKYNLHTILDLPRNVFSSPVKTVVLFFEKKNKTKNIWYYELNLNKNLGKRNPLSFDHLKDFKNLFNSRKDTINSWTNNIENIDKNTYDLSVVNPNKKKEVNIRDPKIIYDEINEFNKKIKNKINYIEKNI